MVSPAKGEPPSPPLVKLWMTFMVCAGAAGAARKVVANTNAPMTASIAAEKWMPPAAFCFEPIVTGPPYVREGKLFRGRATVAYARGRSNLIPHYGVTARAVSGCRSALRGFRGPLKVVPLSAVALTLCVRALGGDQRAFDLKGHEFRPTLDFYGAVQPGLAPRAQGDAAAGDPGLTPRAQGDAAAGDPGLTPRAQGTAAAGAAAAYGC